MSPAIKVLIGLVFIIVGLGLFVDEVSPVVGTSITWLTNFVIILTGIIPAFLILVGLFLVWLEIDEMKAQKQLAKETAKQEAAKPEPKPAEAAPAEPAKPAKAEKKKK